VLLSRNISVIYPLLTLRQNIKRISRLILHNNVIPFHVANFDQNLRERNLLVISQNVEQLDVIEHLHVQGHLLVVCAHEDMLKHGTLDDPDLAEDCGNRFGALGCGLNGLE
jgi:hypothetical protein